MPSTEFYKLDFFARMLMVGNSSINFIVYCSISSPFKVRVSRSDASYMIFLSD